MSTLPRTPSPRKPRPTTVVLCHTTPLTRLPGILASGILPELSKGARKESWLHTPGKRDWALSHVRERHHTDRVVSLRLSVRRDWITRRRPGVYTVSRPIPASMIQAVSVVGLLTAAAA